MKKISFLYIFFLVATFSYNFAQTPKRAITAEDYFKVKVVDNAKISPDGIWAAYTVTETDLQNDKKETRIWIVPVDGGEAIPMTSKGYSAFSPAWSPDGKYLSFMAAKGEGNKTQVWALNRSGGEAHQLTNVKQGIISYSWSPDSKRLLLRIRDQKPELMNDDKTDDNKPRPYVIDRLQFKRDGVGYLDQRRTHLYIYTLHSSEVPIQITSGDFDHSEPVWSPDGTSIAFVSNRTNDPDANTNTDIWIVSANTSDKGETLLQLTKNPGRDHQPCWSPDGKSIAYRTVVVPPNQAEYAVSDLAVISIKGGEPTLLTQNLDRRAFGPLFSADGKSLWFMLEDNGEEQLVKMNLADKTIERKVTGETIVWEYEIKNDIIVALSSRYDLPYELFSFKGDRFEQLTYTNKAFLDSILFSKPEKIKFKSKDGTSIEGYMYKPHGYDSAKKYPTILWIHGGPVAQYNTKYAHRPQFFAANGYLVLELNPRGSSGYGFDFSYAIYQDWGNLDYQDVIAGIDYVIAQGIADPDRLGVGGWSYGGILTNNIITKTNRFKAAISGASISQFRANYGVDDVQLQSEHEFGLPWENTALWERLSPFNHVNKIQTPTLWMCGEHDWRSPVINSEQMYQAMKRLGRETQLVVYPDEAHWPMNRPSFEVDRAKRYVAWFDKHLKSKN